MRWARRILMIVAAGLLFVGGCHLPLAQWNNPMAPNRTRSTADALEYYRQAKLPNEVLDALRPLSNQPKLTGDQFNEQIAKLLDDATREKYRDTLSGLTLRPRSGFWAKDRHQNDDVSVANLGETTGGFVVSAYTFERTFDGVLIKMTGDSSRDESFKHALEASFNRVTKGDYKSVESWLAASPNFRSPSGIGLDTLLEIGILLVGLAALPRSKILTSLLVIPALVGTAILMFQLRGFVHDAEALKRYGLVLEPSLGHGLWVVLLGASLAAIGALLVWLEPPGAAAPTNRVSQ